MDPRRQAKDHARETYSATPTSTSTTANADSSSCRDRRGWRGNQNQSRRRRTPHRCGTASGDTAASAYGYGIEAGKTKYGPRSEWGPAEFAQAAISALHPRGIPRNVNHSKLTKDVNDEQLAHDPDFKQAGYHKVSRQTVIRALEKLRAANR